LALDITADEFTKLQREALQCLRSGEPSVIDFHLDPLQFDEKFGVRLERLRNRRGFRWRPSLAAAIGVSVEKLTRWETVEGAFESKRLTPTYNELMHLARVLSVTPEYLKEGIVEEAYISEIGRLAVVKDCYGIITLIERVIDAAQIASEIVEINREGKTKSRTQFLPLQGSSRGVIVASVFGGSLIISAAGTAVSLILLWYLLARSTKVRKRTYIETIKEAVTCKSPQGLQTKDESILGAFCVKWEDLGGWVLACKREARVSARRTCQVSGISDVQSLAVEKGDVFDVSLKGPRWLIRYYGDTAIKQIERLFEGELIFRLSDSFTNRAYSTYFF